jgi:transcriptional regulator with XRE-family HTH domain
MPFRPQSLPYKLRALFDANVLSPQDLARSVGVTTAQVDGWLRGRLPDAVTRLQVDKVLSYHTRLRNRHLKLEPEVVEGPKETAPVRGIKETRHEFPGVRAFHVISSQGEKRLEVIAPAGDVDEMLWEFMEDWLNRLDPPLALISSEDQEAGSPSP